MLGGAGLVLGSAAVTLQGRVSWLGSLLAFPAFGLLLTALYSSFFRPPRRPVDDRRATSAESKER